MSSYLGRILGLELLFVLLWNSGFIGAEYGLPYTGPWSLLFWRYVALAGLLGLWLAANGRLSWPGNRAVGHTALVGVLAHGVWLACVLVALDMAVPAGIVALVTALQPLLTGALSGPVLGERTDARQWLGLVLGFTGVVIAVGARLSQDAATPALGYLIPFGSVVGITIASLLQRRWAQAGTSASLPLDTTLFYQSVATALALMLPAWWLEGFAVQWAPPFLATMGWLIVAVSLGAYWAMWRLLARDEATRVASLFYLSPPVTMLMAWAAFGDGLIATDVLGLAVAGAGVMLVYRIGARRPATASKPSE
ncbi:DMT family transporter [Thiohalorhabdus methylotrophus]|uniref:DMT family transporter n=1 Tax=Thiohalorhabdus methylotrophus TaxID=3242694 RepID=A0ABV4U131_9GAMM